MPPSTPLPTTVAPSAAAPSVFASDVFASSAFAAERFVLDCRGRPLDCRPGLAAGAHVMGILNVTPDSFSDGGRFLDPSDALRRAEAMLEEGAAIIDVGGESTRPGAEALSADEERRRVRPVIEALARELPEALLSVDTYKPDVAREALAAGAHLVNDVTGLRHFPEMAAVCAEAGAPLIVMHSAGAPGDLTRPRPHSDVVIEVKASLAASVKAAEEAGVRHVVVDPGFGFGKSVQDNLRLAGRTDALLALWRPVLVGISRKSSIGAALASAEAPAPVPRRLFGTLGATAVAVLRGATLVRTHDARPTVEMLSILAATAAAAS